MENNAFSNINMQDALKTARELGVAQGTVATPSETPVLASEPHIARPELPEVEAVSGLVVNTQEVLADMEQPQIQSPSVLNDESMGNISEYLAEMDETIETAKEIYAENHTAAEVAKKASSEEIELEDDEDDEDKDEQEEFLKDYSEAVVIIDKTGMGTVNFTAEEREKLEQVKKIKVEEVETLELATIKTKKAKKKNIGKILQKAKNTLKTTNIVLPASGYTAVVKGCSAYELLELVRDSKNPLVDNETKWTLIYNKIESTSVGKFKDFNDFLSKTSTLDYNVFIYGILCATYPDDDVIPLTCQKCNKEFDHNYTIKSLIRVEQMDEALQQMVAAIIDASHTLPTALDCQANAPINEVKRYKLPQSEIIVDLYIQSVHDFIYESVKKLSDKKDSKYAQASILSTVVNAFYVQDEDGSYFEITDPEEITEVIYNLNDIDIKLLNVKMQDILAGKQFSFGLMDMTCPHCKNYVETLEMNVEQILFFRYQKALNTEIE